MDVAVATDVALCRLLHCTDLARSHLKWASSHTRSLGSIQVRLFVHRLRNVLLQFLPSLLPTAYIVSPITVAASCR